MPNITNSERVEAYIPSPETPAFDNSPDSGFEASRERSAEKSFGEKDVSLQVENPVTYPVRRPDIATASLTLSAVSKSPVLIDIEKILEDDLKETYSDMDSSARLRFKLEGEKTARAIEKLLRETTVKANKIFSLILKWLAIIPGVNKVFIRQEAKIKTDHILNLKK